MTTIRVSSRTGRKGVQPSFPFWLRGGPDQESCLKQLLRILSVGRTHTINESATDFHASVRPGDKFPMSKKHDFPAKIVWTGNRGTGTSTYKAYDRTWDMAVEGKAVVHCSNDPLLGGDATKYNPEDMLIASVASCHMLWYLHLCSQSGVTVIAYEDEPIGIGESEPDGTGRFLEAVLKPRITITSDSNAEKAVSLHDEVHKYCFIARSINFPVRHEPRVFIQQDE